MSNPDPAASEPPDAEPRQQLPVPPVDCSANPIREDVEIFEPDVKQQSDPFPWAPGDFGTSPFRPPPSFRPAEPTFHVPTRFGMSAIIGITTALAVLFGLFRAFGAHEVLYLFFGLLSMVICIVQMRFGDVPRQASIIAGAVMMPLFLIGAAMYVDSPHRGEFACLVVFSIPLGGFLGYVTGTFAGGIFLLMDMFEKYWTRRSAAAEAKSSGPSAA
jgi:hypothetical protein